MSYYSDYERDKKTKRMLKRRRHIASSACSCFSIASSSASAVFLTADTISIPHRDDTYIGDLPSGTFVAPGGRCIGAGSAPFNISFS